MSTRYATHLRPAPTAKVEAVPLDVRLMHVAASAMFSGVNGGFDPRLLLSLAARPDNSDVWKLNPLVDWSRDQVWAYLKQHDLPHNVLHDRGYRSIGCWPCTQPTSGGDERGGRWPGFEKKECGLHTRTKK